MNQQLESSLDEWDQQDSERQRREESLDQIESEYGPFATKFLRVYAFPYDESYVPEGNEQFDLLEIRFRELGRELLNRKLYPWLCGFEFEKPNRKIAVELLKMACRNTPKGEIAKFLRDQNINGRAFHPETRLVPDFDQGESWTIAYGVWMVWWYLKKFGVRTPPLTHVQISKHAGVKLHQIQYAIRSGKLNGIGEGQKKEWLHTEEDEMRQILGSIQAEMLPKPKKSQKSQKKTRL